VEKGEEKQGKGRIRSYASIGNLSVTKSNRTIRIPPGAWHYLI